MTAFYKANGFRGTHGEMNASYKRTDNPAPYNELPSLEAATHESKQDDSNVRNRIEDIHCLNPTTAELLEACGRAGYLIFKSEAGLLTDLTNDMYVNAGDTARRTCCDSVQQV